MLFVLNLLLIVSAGIYIVGLLLFFIGLYFPNRKTQDEKMTVSVIVAARNEEDTIARLLADLSAQTYPKDRFEIIVVNDHSEDCTADIVRRFADKDSRIQLLNSETAEHGLTPKKNALHLGIRKSRGEIILTTDADCRVLPTWIESMVSYFTPDVGMVVGFSQLSRRGDRQSLFQKIQAVDFLTLMAAAQGSLNSGWPLAASGQNLAYRRQAFDQVGGFSRIGHRVSGDDILLLQLVHKKTFWKIRFAPSRKGFNTSEPEKTLRDLFNQRKRWTSNGSYQRILNKPFFGYIAATFMLNLSIIIQLPIMFLLSRNPTLPLVVLGFKLLVEWLILWKGCSVVHRSDLLKIFPIWFILQIPYVVLVGLIGTVGGFMWKGRTHAPSQESAE
ncbi:MAG: glycosyltransferase [bacterium]